MNIKKNQQGSVGLVIVVIVLFLAIFGLFRLMGSVDINVASDEIKPSELPKTDNTQVVTPSDTSIEEDNYFITLPKGWRRVSDDMVNPEWGERRIVYKRATFFFMVAENATTNPTETDLLWQYSFNPAAKLITISSMPTFCVQGEVLTCKNGDGHLYIQITRDGTRPIPDDSLQFYAGDELQEDYSKAPLDEFRQLVNSVRLK